MYDLELLKTTRKNVLNAVENLTIEQFNTIPKGFSNNIIWNLAHIVVTQQLLCYGLSENTKLIADDKIDKFRKGSKPTEIVSAEEIEFWKKNLIELSDRFILDYEKGIFTKYNEYPTSYNIVLKNIEDALKFNNTHDALHFGYIMALKKAVI